LKTLQEHRESLKNNVDAYTHDIPRCYETVVKHLKDAGYKKITFNRAREEIIDFVSYIFESQNKKPFFHINSSCGLPFCWNSPSKGGWEINFIKYEWGHLNSLNQNGESAYNIENLCLQSARCNQHIQSSMNVDELLEYEGKLGGVIIKNKASRSALFGSEKWQSLLNRLEIWR
jgi:hypothetical protein